MDRTSILFRFSRRVVPVAVVVLCSAAWLSPVLAQQPTIKYMIPDAGAPGMAVQVDIIAARDSVGAFGQDGSFPSNLFISLVDPYDTARVRIGPAVVRYYGRLLHTMIVIDPSATPGPVPIRVIRGAAVGNIDTFFIVTPDHIGVLQNGYLKLGDGTKGHGKRTKCGTIVADSIILTSGRYGFSTADPDLATPGNQGMLPVTVLVSGRFFLDNVSSLHADGSGADAAPGGGGGMGNIVLQTCTPPPSAIGAGSGFAAGVAWGTATTGIGSGGSGKSLAGSQAFESGGPASPFDDGPVGGGGGQGTVDANHTAGGGGGGANALAGGNGNSGSTSDASKAIGSLDIVPLVGGGGGGSGAADGLGCPQSGRGGGGGGGVMIFADSGVILQGEGYADGAAGGQAQCSGSATNAGGGGGGAGGSFYFASGRTVEVDGRISAQGGNSGGPCGTGFGGGQGGDGRVRVDGPQTGNGSFTPLVHFHGPSVSAQTFANGALDTIFGTGNPGDSVIAWLMNVEDGMKRAVGPFYATVNPQSIFGIHVAADSMKQAVSDSLLAVVVAQRATDLYTGALTWVMGPASAKIIDIPHGLLVPADGAPDTLLDFGTVDLGKSLIRDIAIVNTGTKAITISSIRPDVTLGTNIFTVPNPTLPVRINAGSTVILSVKFTPLDTTEILDSLAVIGSEIGTRAYFLHVHGAGREARTISRSHLRVDSVMYLAVAHPGDSVLRSHTVRCVGPDSIHITSTALGGPDDGWLHTAQGGPLGIAPGDSSTVGVLFTPRTMSSLRISSLSIMCDDSVGQHVVQLREMVRGDSLFPSRICMDKSSVGDTVILVCNTAKTAVTVSTVACVPSTAGFAVASFSRRIVPGDCGQIRLHYDHPQSATLTVTLQGQQPITTQLSGDCSVGVHDVQIPTDLVDVYPNPCVACSAIFLTGGHGAAVGDGEADVCDVLGRVVARTSAAGLRTAAEGSKISMDAVPAGLYYVRVVTDSHTSVIPLAVVR